MIAMRDPAAFLRRRWQLLGQDVRRAFAAWAVLLGSYFALWLYYAARYGLWYAGPVPGWLQLSMAFTLGGALLVTAAVFWLIRRKERRRP